MSRQNTFDKRRIEMLGHRIAASSHWTRIALLQINSDPSHFGPVSVSANYSCALSFVLPKKAERQFNSLERKMDAFRITTERWNKCKALSFHALEH